MAEKVGKDISSGKLSMDNHDDRMEVKGWTEVILLQEQVLGQCGYILRNVSSQRNFAGFLATVCGRAIGAGGQAAAPSVTVEF
jgi:hypothetical protein